ncbi:membrane protein insertase YidC [uncultured Brachyspira sp.]|uniref:membrane protein insertase YidC n=1 Tax=uncultured Brachyspira sp. TaxID=221953 RepID=UPI0026354F01|nr:membrane protein insertase YidC [uncultured Brachyspira sp.]
MMFFDILYNITIYPIEFIIEMLFYLFNNIFKLNYAYSLFLLSLSVNVLLIPLYNVSDKWKKEEEKIQSRMKPDIDIIKKTFKGDEKFLLLQACYKIYGYKTIYAFRGTLGLLIQIPFFMAAYYFIHDIPNLASGSFLFIKDFSKPDSLLKIGNLAINVLPFIMTLFSLLSGLVYSKKLKFKESLPLYAVSLVFLVLLYSSPSGLLFYWTINCLFSLIKNIIIEYKVLHNKKINFHKYYNILILTISIILIFMFFLGNIQRKGYLLVYPNFQQKDINYKYDVKLGYYSKIFKNSDLYGVTVNTNNLDFRIIDLKFGENGSPFGVITLTDEIENIGELYVNYKLFIKKSILIFYLILLLIAIIINNNNILSNIKSFLYFIDDKIISIENKTKLILVSCLVISFLSGFFIPTSLVSSSPSEFDMPYKMIFNDFFMSIGMFLFYPFFIYFLFSEKIKSYLTVALLLILNIALVNTFIMVGDYGFITSNFTFDLLDNLLYTNKDILVNIAFIMVFSVITLILVFNSKVNIVVNLLYIVLLAISIISISNIYNINKELKDFILYKNTVVSNNQNLFKFSKTGNNILVVFLDSAVPSYWNDAFKMYPDYKKDFDGFTLYLNTVSLGLPTLGSVSSLYGGYEYSSFELSTNNNFNMTNSMSEALIMLPMSLVKYGYESCLYSISYLTYFKVPIEKYTNINNIVFEEKFYDGITNKFFNDKGIYGAYTNKLNNIVFDKTFRFSLFRMLPVWLRYSFYQDSKWLIKSKYDININNSINSYYELLEMTNIIDIEENGNYYNVFDSSITHMPNVFNSKYLPTEYYYEEIPYSDLKIYKNFGSVVAFYANMAAINTVTNMIHFLKDNELYDNTKIIIISDHGNGISYADDYNIPEDLEFLSLHNSLLLFKDFNSRGECIIDTNFMTAADMPYLATKHIPNIENYFTSKIITNDYKTNGVYIIKMANNDLKAQYPDHYNFTNFYHVKDNIFNIDNWKKFEIDWNTKKITELNIKNNN